MSAKNDITGDNIVTKPTTKQYGENYDKIFRKESEASILERILNDVDDVDDNSNSGGDCSS